ncbi:unnamed protein product, partial [Iphiclides podalirius]
MADKQALPPNTVPRLANFVLGGASGMMAVAVVQPADLLKTRMQLLAPKVKLSTFVVAERIVAKEGVLGLYAGLSAALCRQATYTTSRLGFFNTLMDNRKSSVGPPSFPTKLGIASVSGGMAAIIGNPAEVALVRMTADGRLPADLRRNYRNVFNAIARITREEGFFTLFRGVQTSAMRSMIVNAVQLGTYAQAREKLLERHNDGIKVHFAAAMIAGLCTTCIYLPVDIVKTRVQNAAARTGQFRVLVTTIRNEGALKLWSGFLATYTKLGPQTVLLFLIFEQLKALYLRIF